jgi:hypothetical protein
MVALREKRCRQLCGLHPYPINLEMLKECFSRAQVAIRKQTMVLPGQPPEETLFIPYFHFSAHGNESGLGLTNGEFVSWADLRELLVNFAEATGYMSEKGVALFTVTLSACKGANARKMLSMPAPQPCFAVVGPTHDVSWTDSLTAFITFFHQMIDKDKNAHEAVLAMNQAAGLTDAFQCTRFLDVSRA